MQSRCSRLVSLLQILRYRGAGLFSAASLTSRLLMMSRVGSGLCWDVILPMILLLRRAVKVSSFLSVSLTILVISYLASCMVVASLMLRMNLLIEQRKQEIEESMG